MNKFVLLFIIQCLISSSIIAQDEFQTDYIRGGIGLALLGSGDIVIPKLEVEYLIPINDRWHFGASSNVGYGKHIDDYFRFWGEGERILDTYTIHVDPNIYLRTISIENFHMYTGLGVSFMFVNDIQRILDIDGSFIKLEDARFSVGGNIIFQFYLLI